MSELAASVLPGASSLVISVGDVVIDVVPGWLERAAISVLGRHDKSALIAGILLVAGLLGAALGLLARYRSRLALAGFAVFAAVGVLAGLTDPRTSASIGVVGTAGGAAGMLSLRWLLRSAAAPVADHSRRTFLFAAVVVTGAALVTGVTGVLLSARDRLDEIRTAIRLPDPVRRLGAPPRDAELAIDNVAPLFTPNRDFYRIDTALRVPLVEPDGWRLHVRGRVDRPFSLTYEELLARPQIEVDATMVCVSNEVGGNLVGNARWQGVPLSALLGEAGVQQRGTQVIGRSVDGFTAGFPTRSALETAGAMVAVAMNGEPLPARHGFPARLVVPGLYGYVSATKWLTAIELTDSATDGYWIGRGWAKDGRIKTQSRIDVPVSGSEVARGRQVVAGVAWAPTRGVAVVEVRIDGGAWQRAEVADPLGVDCWRQWFLVWDAEPGEHVLAVRAIDGAGEVQTPVRTKPVPTGATGHHTVVVGVL